MRILVCYKYIRDEEQITVNADRSLAVEQAAWVISPYDLNAIEAGMKLAASAGDSSVEVISAGGEVLDNSKMRKAVLSRGPAKMYGLRVDECGDLLSTARLLGQAIEKVGADLVICGEGSGDMYSQILGCLLGAELGRPTLNCVSSLSWEDGALRACRTVGGRTERFDLSLPAVVSVTSDICLPHLPSMKEILAAGKKPVEILLGSDFEQTAPAVSEVSVLAPESAERRRVVFRESDETGLDDFVKELRKYM